MTETEQARKKSGRFNRCAGYACLLAGCGAELALLALRRLHITYHRLWQGMYGKIPDPVFFRWEEILAYTDRGSGWTGCAPLIPLLIGLTGMLLMTRGQRRRYDYPLAAAVFTVMTLLSMPCLCAPKETVNRVVCMNEYKREYARLEQAGTKPPPDGGRFVILEDAPRRHPGDLRHRLWSDGKVDHYYPWKQDE